MVLMHKMIISPGFFFFFFKKTLIFWIVRRVIGQKMAQNDKTLRSLHFISQEPYIIWSWFMVHMCKRIISPEFFSFFQNFTFRVKDGKKWPKWHKKCVTPNLRNCTLYDYGFWYTFLKGWYLQQFFFIFSKFWFFRFFKVHQ